MGMSEKQELLDALEAFLMQGGWDTVLAAHEAIVELVPTIEDNMEHFSYGAHVVLDEFLDALLGVLSA